MFNDLSENQKPSGVDDIFAETDKISTPNTNENSNIETRQVGLSATTDKDVSTDEEASLIADYENENSGSGKILKIAIFIVVGAIIILGAYLVYANFLAPEKNTEVVNEVVNNDLSSNPVAQEDPGVVAGVVKEENDFVIPIVEREDDVNDIIDAPVIETDLRLIDSDGDGLTDYEEIYIYNTNPNLIDTDFDGLTDYEEVKIYGTDPLNPDTDGDGLTDYEEVKVYGTDPLNPDTDGDGYSDYEEVMNGYNPLGEGLLPGFSR